MIEQIREELQASADEKYREFNHSLVPGDTASMIGVRMPKLREIAKRIAGRTKKDSEEGFTYIKEILEQEKQGQAYHEELLLHGMVAGYLKCDMETRKQLLDGFVPVIHNWAVCDSCCMTYKFMKKDQEEWFSYLQKYLNSTKEFEVRFAVVILLDYFVNEAFIERVLNAVKNIKQEEYYVKMAVAWAISVCYVKFPKETDELFTENCLDDFTHNKAIQKIRESFRVTKEAKDRLNRMKRK